MAKKGKIICGLDVGTTKICTLIARTHPGKGLEVVSTGYAQSGGIKKGVVVDLEEAVASIRKATDEAELKSHLSVDWVVVGVSGDHVQSFNSHGTLSIEGKHQEVTPEHVSQVIQAAQTILIAPDREVIHLLPQEFFLDNRGDIRNPVGLTGSRLDVNIHIVTCESSPIQNLINAVNRAQMRVKKVVLPQLASAEAVLTSDEKELGAAVVDIGGGTTDIALVVRNAIRFTSVLPVGGAHFTRDLAIGLRTPVEEAERIKKETGTLLTDGIAGDEAVSIPGVGDRASRDLPRQVICQILRDRAIELLQLVNDQITRSGEREQLAAGAVLTGGGSMLEGMIGLAEQVLQMPVRWGLPRGVGKLSEELSHPIYATAIGLAMCDSLDTGRDERMPGNANTAPWFLNRLLSWVGS